MTTIIVRTANGLMEIPATRCGPLAIHSSVNIGGFSITHVESGLNIISRLTTKSVALQLAHYLCTRTDCVRPVIPPDDLASIRVVLQAVPRRLIRKHTSTKSKTRGPPGSDEASTEEAHHLTHEKGRRP